MEKNNAEKFSLLSIPKRSVAAFVAAAIFAWSGFFVLKYPQIVTSQRKIDLVDYAISGNVKSDGLDLPNAFVILRGTTATSTTQTDAGGNYSFNNLQAGSYTISAAKQRHVFTPANQVFPNLQSNQIANFSGVPHCAPPSANLSAWYKGEGNAQDSSRDNHGTFVFGASSAPGKVNQAFSFDGIDDYMSLTYPYVNDFGTGDFTVEFWVKFNDLATNGNGLISKDNAAAGWLFNIDDAKGGVGFETRNTAGGADNNARYATSNFLADSWYHLAGIRRGGNLELYVNGVLRAAAAESIPTNVSNTTFLKIGALSSAAPQQFAGSIDEAKAYHAALSAAEIQNIYESGSAGVCASNIVFTTHRNAKIAFSSLRVIGGNQLFTINTDGSNPINITNQRSSDTQPAWSPDGSKIAFAGSRNGNTSEIVRMNADGSNQISLTNDGSENASPSWSPDGAKIVFQSKRTGGGDIYIMNADGTNQTRLTTDPNSDAWPKFSPDGSKIIFQTNRDGNYEIYLMNADGSNQTRLTNNTTSDFIPAFSPDGSKIVFYRNWQIFVMNADGSNQVNISNNPASDWLAAWSPDGTKIVFTRDLTAGGEDIYVMNADGTNQTALTNVPAADNFPAWQIPNQSVSISPSSDLNLTFSNVTRAGNTIADLLSPNQLPALPVGLSLFASAPAYDIRTTAAHSGNATVSLRVPNVTNPVICSELRLIHFETNAWSMTNNGAPSYNAGTHVCTISQMVTTLSPFAVVKLTTVASNVSVGGRILSANGTGIRNVVIFLIDANGASRAAQTSAFGYYNFDDVPIGTAIISVSAKRFTFANPTQVINVSDNIGDINWTAIE